MADEVSAMTERDVKENSIQPEDRRVKGKGRVPFPLHSLSFTGHSLHIGCCPVQHHEVFVHVLWNQQIQIEVRLAPFKCSRQFDVQVKF